MFNFISIIDVIKSAHRQRVGGGKSTPSLTGSKNIFKSLYNLSLGICLVSHLRNAKQNLNLLKFINILVGPSFVDLPQVVYEWLLGNQKDIFSCKKCFPVNNTFTGKDIGFITKKLFGIFFSFRDLFLEKRHVIGKLEIRKRTNTSWKNHLSLTKN